MLVQFTVVKDESVWMLNTVGMSYVRAESNSENAKILEMGKLIFVGLQGPLRIFALEGRTPTTEGPGAGFCTFGYGLIDLDTTITFFLQANVQIKDINSRRPVDTVRYELIPNREETPIGDNKGPNIATEAEVISTEGHESQEPA